VLQRFDPAAGRYRTLESARIETPREPIPPPSGPLGLPASAAPSELAASGLRPDIVPIDDDPPLGSGLSLSDLESDN
jgi:hypothetical protein